MSEKIEAASAPKSGGATAVGIFAALGLAAAGGALASYFERQYPILADGVWVTVAAIAVPLAALLVALAFLVEKRTSQKKDTYQMMALPLIVAAPLITWAGLHWVNGALDRTTLQIQTEIASSGTSSGRGATTYYIYLRAGDFSTEATKIRVSKETHSSYKQGNKILATIGEGRLGFRWLRSMKHE